MKLAPIPFELKVVPTPRIVHIGGYGSRIWLGTHPQFEGTVQLYCNTFCVPQEATALVQECSKLFMEVYTPAVEIRVYKQLEKINPVELLAGALLFESATAEQKHIAIKAARKLLAEGGEA